MTMLNTLLTPDHDNGLQRLGSNESASLRVVLADGHRMVLEILSDTLTLRASMEVTKASTLAEALALAETTCDVDLIVLDFDLPGMRGYEGLARMVALKRAPVVVLAGAVHPGMAEAVRAAGGAGLLCKTQGVFDIVQRMLDLGRGETFFHPTLAVNGMHMPAVLTETQTRVMQMIESGLSNGDIGLVMGMALSLVKMHVRSIFKRLNARNRTDAVRIWHNSAPLRAHELCDHP